ncbi:hypothetical protein MY4824_000840 [Beauveria thailandica]
MRNKIDDMRTGLLNSTHAHLGHNTQVYNATNGTLDIMIDFSADATGNVKYPCDVIIACVILGIIFAFFFAIVAIDMRAKYRSGELHDDLRGIKKVLVLMLKAVPMLLVALMSKIRSLIPRKQAVSTEADSEAAAQKTRESQVIVQRLAAKSESEGTTSSVALADVAPFDVAPVSVSPVCVDSFGGGSLGNDDSSSSNSSSSNSS